MGHSSDSDRLAAAVDLRLTLHPIFNSVFIAEK
jgi:hypothetical protein